MRIFICVFLTLVLFTSYAQGQDTYLPFVPCNKPNEFCSYKGTPREDLMCPASMCEKRILKKGLIREDDQIGNLIEKLDGAHLVKNEQKLDFCHAETSTAKNFEICMGLPEIHDFQCGVPSEQGVYFEVDASARGLGAKCVRKEAGNFKGAAKKSRPVDDGYGEISPPGRSTDDAK